jgi:hypothetical protein
MNDIPLDNTLPSTQNEPIKLLINKARGLFSKYFISNSTNIFDVLERSLIPLLSYLDDGGGSKSKSSKKEFLIK